MRKVRYWKDVIFPYIYNVPVNGHMLTEQGFTKEVGRGNKAILVKFDKYYVVEKLTRDLKNVLGNDREAIKEIIDEVLTNG